MPKMSLAERVELAEAEAASLAARATKAGIAVPEAPHTGANLKLIDRLDNALHVSGTLGPKLKALAAKTTVPPVKKALTVTDQFAAITDPAERSKFYNQHRAELTRAARRANQG